MGFLMDGLDPEAYDRVYSDRELVKRILGYFRPEARRMLVVALAIVLISLLDTGLPIAISYGLDRLQQGPSAGGLLAIAALIALLACTSWGFNAVRQRLAARAVGNVVLKLREDACDAVLQRDLSFYDAFSSGKVVSRVTSDTQAFSQVITLTMDLLSRLLLVVLLIGYLFTVSVHLTLILLALAPFVIGAALAFRAIARLTITHARRASATVSTASSRTPGWSSVFRATAGSVGTTGRAAQLACVLASKPRPRKGYRSVPPERWSASIQGRVSAASHTSASAPSTSARGRLRRSSASAP